MLPKKAGVPQVWVLGHFTFLTNSLYFFNVLFDYRNNTPNVIVRDTTSPQTIYGHKSELLRKGGKSE